MVDHDNALGVVSALRPAAPVTLVRPHAAARAARFFTEKFPGLSMYAVKANPSPDLLRVLYDNGVTHYDVASIAEVRLVRDTLPEAKLCFMHPVKAAEAIAEAYHTHGVRVFSLDSEAELEKIMTANRRRGRSGRSASVFACPPRIRSSASPRSSARVSTRHRRC